MGPSGDGSASQGQPPEIGGPREDPPSEPREAGETQDGTPSEPPEVTAFAKAVIWGFWVPQLR